MERSRFHLILILLMLLNIANAVADEIRISDLQKLKITGSNGIEYFTAKVEQKQDPSKTERTSDDKIKAASYITIGSAVSIVAAKKVLGTFFEMPAQEYYQKTDPWGRPRQVLIIVGAQDDVGLEYVKYLVESRHHGAISKIIRANDFQSLGRQLVALPQARQFDQIEIIAHGAPGALFIGKEGKQGRNLVGLMASKLDLASAGATLRLTSCSIGVDRMGSSYGSEMMDAIGRTFLAQGGKVVAPTRAIYTKSPVPTFLNLKSLKLLIKRLASAIFTADRSYSQSLPGFREVTIPARDPKAYEKCIGKYMLLLFH